MSMDVEHEHGAHEEEKEQELVRWDRPPTATSIWPSRTRRYAPYPIDEYERHVRTQRASGAVATATATAATAISASAAAPASTPAANPLDLLPIVIDHGAFELRAGFAHEDEPRLRYRNLVGRPKSKRPGEASQIRLGNQLTTFDAWRLKARSPFEGDLLTLYDNVELMLDHTFASLGLGRCERVDHPIVFTEPLANPNSCRSRVSELLFEAYGAPSVAYGIDMLFSLHENRRRGRLAHAASSSSTHALDVLVVGCSYNATYVAPVLGGQPVLPQAMRIDVGSRHAHDMLYTDMNLHYPQHRAHFTPFRAQQLVEDYCVVAPTSYVTELERMRLYDVQRSSQSQSQSQSQSSLAHPPIALPIRIQLPVPQIVRPVVSEEELREKERRRQANIERLKAAAAQRRVATLAKLRSDVQQYDALRADRASGAVTEAQFLATLRRGGFENEKDFESTYKSLRRRLQQMQPAQAADTDGQEGQGGGGGDDDGLAFHGDGDDDDEGDDGGVGRSSSAATADPFPLVNVPDDQLTPEQIKEKRKQRLLKGLADARERRRKQKEEEAARAREAAMREEEEFQRDRAGFLARLREARQAILDQRAERGRTRGIASGTAGGSGGGGVAGVAGGGGASVLSDVAAAAASQKRMALLVSMTDDKQRSHAGGRRGGTKASAADDDDTFGMRDEDWHVYREAAVPHQHMTEADPESDAEREELARLESKLLAYDPEFAASTSAGAGAATSSSNDPTPEQYQVELFVNRIRLPEIVFEPLIAGVDQCGLVEVIRRVLARVDADEAARMCQNVFVTGGTSLFPHMIDRLVSEITAIRPAGSSIVVRHAQNPTLDAWLGARSLAVEHFSNANSSSSSSATPALRFITRSTYDECGAEYLVEHACSNAYHPTPAPDPNQLAEVERDRKRKRR